MLDSPTTEIDFLAMRRLLLLRHAKSDWTGIGLKDQDRGLASRGRDSAPRIGAYMAHHALIPDLVLSSTATRARDTWSLVAEAFRMPPPVSYEERLYETAPKAILDVIQNALETRVGGYTETSLAFLGEYTDASALLAAAVTPEALRIQTMQTWAGPMAEHWVTSSFEL